MADGRSIFKSLDHSQPLLAATAPPRWASCPQPSLIGKNAFAPYPGACWTSASTTHPTLEWAKTNHIRAAGIRLCGYGLIY